jgi:hypothetical protein
MYVVLVVDFQHLYALLFAVFGLKVGQKIKQILLGGCVTAFLHFKMNLVLPLAIQMFLAPYGTYESPLFKVHCWTLLDVHLSVEKLRCIFKFLLFFVVLFSCVYVVKLTCGVCVDTCPRQESLGKAQEAMVVRQLHGTVEQDARPCEGYAEGSWGFQEEGQGQRPACQQQTKNQEKISNLFCLCQTRFDLRFRFWLSTLTSWDFKPSSITLQSHICVVFQIDELYRTGWSNRLAVGLERFPKSTNMLDSFGM